MTACATHHEGRTSLSKARLQIIRHEGHALTAAGEEDELIFTLAGCQQCEEPVCSLVCPVAAIRRDSTTGAITIDRDTCVGCRACLMTCYFGAISFHQEKKTVFKCELCGGDPQCVRFCCAGALKFAPVEHVPLIKKMETAKKTMTGLLERKEP